MRISFASGRRSVAVAVVLRITVAVFVTDLNSVFKEKPNVAGLGADDASAWPDRESPLFIWRRFQ